MFTLRGNTVSISREPVSQTGQGRSTGVTAPALWTPSRSTSKLMQCLSDELQLGWKIGVSHPDLVVLTNLGRSDLDKMVERRHPLGVILCLDDHAGREFLAKTKLPCFTYSEGRDEADLTAHALRTTSDGLSFVVVTQEELARVVTPVRALYNTLTVLACAVAVGVPLREAASVVTTLLCGSDKTVPPPKENL